MSFTEEQCWNFSKFVGCTRKKLVQEEKHKGQDCGALVDWTPSNRMQIIWTSARELLFLPLILPFSSLFFSKTDERNVVSLPHFFLHLIPLPPPHFPLILQQTFPLSLFSSYVIIHSHFFFLLLDSMKLHSIVYKYTMKL